MLYLILVPVALSFLLAGWALARENEGLLGHRIYSPRFLDFRPSYMQS